MKDKIALFCRPRRSRSSPPRRLHQLRAAAALNADGLDDKNPEISNCPRAPGSTLGEDGSNQAAATGGEGGGGVQVRDSGATRASTRRLPRRHRQRRKVELDYLDAARIEAGRREDLEAAHAVLVPGGFGVARHRGQDRRGCAGPRAQGALFGICRACRWRSSSSAATRGPGRRQSRSSTEDAAPVVTRMGSKKKVKTGRHDALVAYPARSSSARWRGGVRAPRSAIATPPLRVQHAYRKQSRKGDGPSGVH
jgi:hypothetical protein